MKTILSLIISATLVASGYSQTRNVLVGTNNAVVQPTNFWSADASNARTGLGLGTAATSSATSFQPSSAILSNLSVGNGVNLTNLTATIVGTNIAITNVSGLQSSLDSKLETNGSAANLTNFPTLNQSTTGTASNVTGVVGLANGGTGGTNAASARSSLGATTIGASVFTLANPSSIRFIRLNADNSVSALPASDFRTAVGLGTAATNSEAAFQPSSLALTNLSSNNGSGLTNLAISNVVGLQTSLNDKVSTNGNGSGITNITAANIVGTVALASNVSGAIDFTNISGVLTVAKGGTSATNAYNARQNFGATAVGDALFTASNAATARTAIGGTTVGGSIFTLVNPSAITFLRVNADNTVSAIGASDFRTAIGLGSSATNSSGAFQPSSSMLTNLASSNAFYLSNIQASNIVGLLSLSNGGTGANNTVNARANLGLGSASTNPASAFQPSSTVLSNLANSNGGDLTNITISNVTGLLATNGSAAGLTNFPASLLVTNGNGAGLTNLTAANITGSVAVVNGGTGATNSAGARTNLGLGWSGLTNANANDFRSALDLSAAWLTNTNITNLRSDIGLGWPALTNSNAGTGLVSVNTNGEVVSPTNFWQVSPANTRVQNSRPVVNATNSATNARNLYFYSLAISTTGVTNTVQLPTNSATLIGDVATVIHEGPTSSITAVRSTGAGTNLITLNQFQEAVKFIYESSGWRLHDNISQVEPIYFSGTNAAANAAASRTNLGLGASNAVEFGAIHVADIGSISIGTDAENLVAVNISAGGIEFEGSRTNELISFIGTNLASTFRSDIGIPLAALTNTSNTTFQQAIFTTNAAPTNAGNFGDHAAWMGVSIVTNGVTNTFKIPLYK